MLKNKSDLSKAKQTGKRLWAENQSFAHPALNSAFNPKFLWRYDSCDFQLLWTDWNHLPWPGIIVTMCMSYFITGDPGKEHGTNKSTPTGRIQERSEGDATCPTDLPEISLLESILAEQRVHHQEGPWARMIGQRQPGS